MYIIFENDINQIMIILLFLYEFGNYIYKIAFLWKNCLIKNLIWFFLIIA